jgi:hypothetical protein
MFRLSRLLVLHGLALAAAVRAAPVFETDVRPLLKAHCYHCHGEGGKKEGGVDFRLRRFMLHKTADGPVLVPGNTHASRMLELVKSGDMPKGEKKLAPEEIALLEKWIAGGAPTVREEPETIPAVYITDEERSFWSFRPIVKPPVPPGEENPVDAFIAQQLRAAGLDFLPEADTATLARRMSFDLIGLPPAQSDQSDQSDLSEPSTLLENLLASPHYGERWGRHWLDAAGYADSEGYEEDALRPHAWHYRDYVVQAHNDDLPWDRFLTEQLAGDELAALKHDTAQPAIHQPGNAARLAATGFLRMAPDPTGGGVADANLARNQVMAETVKIVSSSLMGLTAGCAQCHDHRYDPISQPDYYRLRAVFEPLYDWKNWRPPGQRLYSLYTDEERAAAQRIETEAQKMDEERRHFALKRLEEIFAERLAKVPDADRESVKTARNTDEGKRTPEQVELLKKYVEANVPKHEGVLLLFDVPANNKRLEMEAKSNAHRATKPKENFVMAATETGAVPDTFNFHRGDHEQAREKIEPAVFEVLSSDKPVPFAKPLAELKTSGRRLAFAHWLTGPRNPLTARVLVNRFWMHHFGRGLVRTPGDFGALGERPTHPELLDWLAADFMEHGWQLKRLHRLILTSKTWRQQSDPHATPERERLYCGWKLQRLDAESVRDAMLAVTGQLNRTVGGEPVSVARDVQTGRIVPGAEVINPGNGMVDKINSASDGALRRSLYIQSRRSRPLTVLETFDLPLMNPNCTSRTVTTVAPQSLLLMNDDFTVQQSQALAARLQREAPTNDAAKITRAWQLLYGDTPSELDTARSLVFLYQQREELQTQGRDRDQAGNEALAAWCQVMLSTNRFLYVE